MNKDRRCRPLVLLLLSLFLSFSLPALFTAAAPIHSAEEMQTRPVINHTTPANPGHQDNPALNPDRPASDVMPPTSQVHLLPAYSKNDVIVHWSGSDDLSGISYFEIQYRVGEQGTWQDWDVYGNKSATFSKQPGKTVYFRSRATDNAGLKEAWPEGDGDTSTTFYNWAIRGKAMDNRLVPITGLSASSPQQPFENNPSNAEGLYSAFFDGYDSIYEIDFQKTGYGSLTSTKFSGLDDATLDVLLPPADNIMADPEFEPSATLASSWSTGGDLVPIITNAQRHTGEQSAFLGSLFQLENIAQFDADPNFTNKPGPKLDDAGRFHLVWYPGGSGDDKNIYYASGDNDGVWSNPKIVNSSPTHISDLLWDVSPDGTVHIVWDSSQGTHDIIYHLWKDDSGWHGPTTVYNIGWASLYALRADSLGAGHLLWQLSGSSFDDSYYSYVNPSGTWSSPDRLYVPYDTEAYNLILDKNDVVHLQWSYSGDDLLHNYRKSDGSWSERELVAPGGYNWYNDLLIDDNNGVHLVWGNVSSGKIFHSKRQSDGTWSSPSYVSGGTEARTETIKAASGPGGTLVLAWTGGGYSCSQPFAAYIDSDGDWTTTKKLHPGVACIKDFWFARTSEQLLMYTDFRQGGVHSVCLLPLGDGLTSQVGECTSMPETSYGDSMPHPMQGPDDLSHVFWRKAGIDNIMELIHSRTDVNETATVSRLYQTIGLSPTQPWPTLSFAYLQKSDALAQSGGLRVIVSDTGGKVVVFSGKGTGSWQYGWVDMAPWTGGLVTVIFELEQTVGESGIWSYVDEVHLGSAYPDSWLDVKDQGPAFPGGDLDLQIHYGNNSSVEAIGTEVELTLPAGLTFVESTPEPTSQNGTIVWDIGTLFHSAGDKTVVVKTEVSGSLTGDELLPVLAVLDTATTELETINNTSEISIALYSEPEADFSATPVAGAPPLVVNFSNNSTGDYSKCLWEFGDDGTSDECHETSHQYENLGAYTVKLTVEGPAGKDTKTETDYISVAYYRVFLPGVLRKK